MLALIGAGIPVGHRFLSWLLSGRDPSPAGRLRGRIRLGRAVVVLLTAAVGTGLLTVRVCRVAGVRDLLVRVVDPAAGVVLLLLVVALGLLVSGILLAGVLLVAVGLCRVVLVVRVLLLRLTVSGLLTGAPVAVLRLLRLLWIVLRLAAVGGLLTLMGLLSLPSAVPVQRVLRMPRFGALAPAILSHRSPRAARRRSRGFRPGSRPASCCAVAVRMPPHRAERYRIAIR